MEFLFLTQNIYIEILILIFLIIILSIAWGKIFYNWLKQVYAIFGGMKNVGKVLVSVGNSFHHEDVPVEPIKNKKKKDEKLENEKITEVWSIEKVDTSQVEKLTNLVSSIRTLIARGMIIEAQTLLVEGLSIEKDHRDLNLILGSIYEHDWHYEKAEYIYKDMAELYSSDIEILEKLANVLIIEKKFTIACEIYKKIHKSIGNTESTLYMLIHISNTLEDYKATLKYAKQYVLQWPKNPDIIAILANTQVTLWLRKDAIETYKHLKNLTPYSDELSDIIQKLLIEEELASNFEVK